MSAQTRRLTLIQYNYTAVTERLSTNEKRFFVTANREKTPPVLCKMTDRPLPSRLRRATFPGGEGKISVGACGSIGIAVGAKPHGVRRYKIYINKAPVALISDRLGADGGVVLCRQRCAAVGFKPHQSRALYVSALPQRWLARDSFPTFGEAKVASAFRRPRRGRRGNKAARSAALQAVVAAAGSTSPQPTAFDAHKKRPPRRAVSAACVLLSHDKGSP